MKTLADIFGVKIEKDMVKKRPMRVEDIDCSSRLEKYFKEHNSKVKHGANKMREQFEKLPEIAKMIDSGDVWWSEKHNNYSGSDSELDCYVDGAWYAYQEQQKKIDSMLDHVCGKHEDFK